MNLVRDTSSEPRVHALNRVAGRRAVEREGGASEAHGEIRAARLAGAHRAVRGKARCDDTALAVAHGHVNPT